MKAGDKIKLQHHVMGYPTKDWIEFTVEEFRFTLGIFESEQHRQVKLEQEKALARDDYEKKEPWTLFGKYGTSTSIEYDNLMRKTFEGGELRGSALVVSVIAVVIGMIVASCNLDWLQILIAPKLYLFEYGASLVK